MVASKPHKRGWYKTEKGAYYVRFLGPEWFPQEAIVDAGVSEIPIRRVKYWVSGAKWYAFRSGW